MTGRSGQRPPGTPTDPALCTDAADRSTSEAAIRDLYRWVKRPPPSFVWVESPRQAEALVPPTPASSFGDDRVENRLATAVSRLRQQLGAPPAGGTGWYGWGEPPPPGGLDGITGHLLAELAPRQGLRWYGQHDSHWVLRAECHLTGRPELEPWSALARSCGWWWPRDGVCVIAERPVVLRTEPTDDGVRLHHDGGPAVAFRDGWGVHAWHGTRLPAWVFTDLTADRILTEPNAEVRRCAVERLGWGTFLEGTDATLVASADDPGNPGARLDLYDVPFPTWAGAIRLLLTVNGSVERDGTRRRYGLRVPAEHTDPVAAAGWTYGLSGRAYADLLRRT